MDAWPVIWSGALMGTGAGLAMGSINFTAISSTTVELRTDAAALYGLFRSIGTAFVITLTSALLAHNLQVNHAEIGGAMQIGSFPGHLPQLLGGKETTKMVATVADLEVNRQALMIAYLDNFWLMKWSMLLLMPAILLLRPMRTPRGEPMMVSE